MIRRIAGNIARIFVLAFALVIATAKSFAGGENSEYNVKAMFILNFMKYVQWPEDFSNGTFTIGVAGESEIFNALQSMTLNRDENSKIRVEMADIEEAGNYQILIISRKENSRIESWVREYEGRGVLIISEECKNNHYAAINLRKVESKIRFEINNTQARFGGIKISSRLFDLAIKVQQ